MSSDTCSVNARKMTNPFERYLTLWVGLCIVGGVLLGKLAPSVAKTFDAMSINVDGAPVVSPRRAARRDSGRVSCCSLIDLSVSLTY